MAHFLFNAGFFILFCFFSPCTGQSGHNADTKSLARGWGDHFHWNTLEQAFHLAKKVDKPIMLIIHKTWCGACKKLRGELAVNEDIAKLKDDFIMVNTEDEEEPKEKKYSPDGGYIPRILFVDSNTNVRDHHINILGNKHYRYFYSSADQVYITMKHVLETWRYNSEKMETDQRGGQVYEEL